MANYFKVNTLVLGRQFLSCTGNDIFVNGNLYGTTHFDSGQAAASGAILLADINSLSGFTTGLSGYNAITYATITNLTQTGVNIEVQITSLSGFVGTQSGFNAATYATVSNLFTSGSNLYGYITSLSGAENLNIQNTGQTLYNDLINISGQFGYVGSFIPLSTGWYRLISGSALGHIGGRLQIYSPTNYGIDFNYVADDEIFIDVEGYANNNSIISWVRHSNYANSHGINSLRVGGDGNGMCVVDLLINGTGANPLGLLFSGPRTTSFISNITSGAIAPTTNLVIETSYKGFGTSNVLYADQNFILSGQSITTINNDILINGVIPYDTSGTAANTGNILITDIISLSGYVGNSSGALNTLINNVATNLTNTGVTIETQINSLSGFTTGQSGFSSLTYATLT